MKRHSLYVRREMRDGYSDVRIELSEARIEGMLFPGTSLSLFKGVSGRNPSQEVSAIIKVWMKELCRTPIR